MASLIIFCDGRDNENKEKPKNIAFVSVRCTTVDGDYTALAGLLSFFAGQVALIVLTFPGLSPRRAGRRL